MTFPPTFLYTNSRHTFVFCGLYIVWCRGAVIWLTECRTKLWMFCQVQKSPSNERKLKQLWHLLSEPCLDTLCLLGSWSHSVSLIQQNRDSKTDCRSDLWLEQHHTGLQCWCVLNQRSETDDGDNLMARKCWIKWILSYPVPCCYCWLLHCCCVSVACGSLTSCAQNTERTQTRGKNTSGWIPYSNPSHKRDGETERGEAGVNEIKAGQDYRNERERQRMIEWEIRRETEREETEKKRRITFFQRGTGRESGQVDGDTVNDRENKKKGWSVRERKRMKAETERGRDRRRGWEKE